MTNKRLDIIYENRQILVVNKPNNLLTISTLNEKENTLYHQVYMYLKRKNQKTYIVNRLDRETSGLVVFAKTEKIKAYLQENWNDCVKRYYVAIVKGTVQEDGTIKSYLKENSACKTYITDKKDGKLAITKYRVIKTNDKYSLLDVEILTGRKNQIRVQLASIGNPILGDRKYGDEEKCKRMYLHASKIEILNSKTGKITTFEKKAPSVFDYLLK